MRWDIILFGSFYFSLHSPRPPWTKVSEKKNGYHSLTLWYNEAITSTQSVYLHSVKLIEVLPSSCRCRCRRPRLRRDFAGSFHRRHFTLFFQTNEMSNHFTKVLCGVVDSTKTLHIFFSLSFTLLIISIPRHLPLLCACYSTHLQVHLSSDTLAYPYAISCAFCSIVTVAVFRIHICRII